MRSWLLLLVCCGAASGQVNTNVLTVRATRTLNLQPDQTNLLVSVSSGTSAALSDVLAALQPAGITEANLSSVGTSFGGNVANAETWDWSFTLTVPLTGLGGTIGSLTTLQQSLSNAANPMTLNFYVQGASVSPQLLAANPCPYTGLFSDAQTQAQKVAAAAGVTLGAVTSLTDGSGIPTQAYAVAVVGVLSSAFFVNPASATTCTMVVQFQLR